ncbi:MAG TPA: hypothetical protein VKV24_19920 [Casimicrobiaceae bacterium]|nr:hypothetical protein [Casimicrobiaceae bacterium]
MRLFAALKKVREFERSHLPFLKAIVDFDIVIEIGYAQEQKQLLTLKQLFLLKLGAVPTIRRRLSKLIEQGIVTRHTNADDRRSSFLALSSSSLKLLGKYGRVLSTISANDLKGLRRSNC